MPSHVPSRSTVMATRLATASETRTLTRTEREALLAAVGAAIDGHGGKLAMPIRTRLCLARKTRWSRRPPQ